ncbi:GNAT family protein [Leucobacter komagatae]|uniref:GNAT family protein n=1 Tax=Leucobacter komagatae TaxID=55969 RepID=UPI00319E9794
MTSISGTPSEGTSPVDVAFARLPAIPISDIRALLNEPRNGRHMPLARDFSAAETAAWVLGKDRQWEEHGYGPWAVLIGGVFAGWGGFEAEADSADFALVLFPAYWGYGARVTIAALDEGFCSLGIETVTIALPLTRNPAKAVSRYGFEPDGSVTHGQAVFRRFRLTRERWARAHKFNTM